MMKRIKRVCALLLVLVMLFTTLMAPVQAVAVEGAIIYVGSKLVIAAVLVACGLIMEAGNEEVWNNLIDRVQEALGFGKTLSGVFSGGTLMFSIKLINSIVQAANSLNAFQPVEEKSVTIQGFKVPYYDGVLSSSDKLIGVPPDQMPYVVSWDAQAGAAPLHFTFGLATYFCEFSSDTNYSYGVRLSPTMGISASSSSINEYWPVHSYSFGPLYVYQSIKYNELCLGFYSFKISFDPHGVANSIPQRDLFFEGKPFRLLGLSPGAISAEFPWTTTDNLPAIDDEGVTYPLTWGQGPTDVVIDGVGTPSLPLSIPSTSIPGVSSQTQAAAQAGALSPSAADASDAAKADELAEAGVNKLLVPAAITDFFPFCIPFDLVKGVQLLQAPAQEPVFDIPISVPYVGTQTIHIDLTQYDGLFVIVRWLFVLIFVIGLAAGTQKVIRW